MTYKELWQPLTSIYDENEARAVVRLVLEKHYGLTMSDIVLGKEQMLPAEELQTIRKQLLTGEPVQYVLGLAEFGPYVFHVVPGVLIPRPETYELCQWMISEIKGMRSEVRDYSILDVGTGSGCIACTLAAELPHAVVTAWDISEKALKMASENASQMKVNVTFELVDVLQTANSQKQKTKSYDLIVSNPPYICKKEQATMERNVLEHEPDIALFVPDDNPLLFYRTIAALGQQNLKPGGWLYFEINPLYADDMQQMLSMMSYHNIEIKEDQYGKQRMIRAQQ